MVTLTYHVGRACSLINISKDQKRKEKKERLVNNKKIKISISNKLGFKLWYTAGQFFLSYIDVIYLQCL